MDFYVCEHCNNVIAMINNSGVNPECCGDPMKTLIPSTEDKGREKHVPVCEKNTQYSTDSQTEFMLNVKVGSEEHPMLENHHIYWIAVETQNGFQIKYLKPNEKPKACFHLAKDENVIAVYEYCNVHGLWKAQKCRN